jgi:hypothetical protein
MDTHTQILFNSPALHSLKRDQLLKLCKTHGVKASGKNAEIVERLQARGLQLQKDATGSLTPSDNPTDQASSVVADASTKTESDTFHLNPNPRYGVPRPSEQWEIVMDTIEELDEASQGTLKSHNSLNRLGAGASGEFGAAGSMGSKCLYTCMISQKICGLYDITSFLFRLFFHQGPRDIFGAQTWSFHKACSGHRDLSASPHYTPRLFLAFASICDTFSLEWPFRRTHSQHCII